MMGRKTVTMAVVLLGLVASASLAITFNEPWNGPVVMHITGWNSSTIWVGNPGTYTDPYDPAAGLMRVAGPGAMQGEDSWGVVRVDSILKGMVMGNKIIAHPSGDHLWVHGDGGQELVGLFYGAQDIAMEITPSGSMVIESKNLHFDLYAQNHGVFNGGVAGSAGRTGMNTYATVGDDASSTLWLSGLGQDGFLGPIAWPETEIVANFNPSVTVDSLSGDGKSYLSVAETLSGTGVANSVYDSNFFVNGAGDATADLSMSFATKLNNPTNAVGARNGFDWTVTVSDPTAMIPEPMTAFLLGIGALPMLLRRRRRVA